MRSEKTHANGGNEVPQQPTVNSITERRQQLARRIGRLLARKWLQQRRQTGGSQDGTDE